MLLYLKYAKILYAKIQNLNTQEKIETTSIFGDFFPKWINFLSQSNPFFSLCKYVEILRKMKNR